MTDVEHLSLLKTSLENAIKARTKALDFKSYDIDTAGGQRGLQSQSLEELSKTIKRLEIEISQLETKIANGGRPQNRIRRIVPL